MLEEVIGSLSKSDVQKFILDNKKTIAAVSGSILGALTIGGKIAGGYKLHKAKKENTEAPNLSEEVDPGHLQSGW